MVHVEGRITVLIKCISEMVNKISRPFHSLTAALVMEAYCMTKPLQVVGLHNIGTMSKNSVSLLQSRKYADLCTTQQEHSALNCWIILLLTI